MLDRYSYQSVVAASEVIHWRIEDIIGGEKRLDFAKPFMPEALARVEELSFLDHEEKLVRFVASVGQDAHRYFRGRGSRGETQEALRGDEI